MRLSVLRRYFRPSAILFTLLITGSWGTTLHAQGIGIRLVNGKNGRPIAGTCVNVWVGNKREDAMAIPTDKDGVASLRLTDKDGEVDIHNRWKDCGDFWGGINPVVKYDDSLRINAGYVLCHVRKPDYSWLAITNFSTKEVLEHGIATANTCGKVTASPKPGEVIIFVRPLTWWEKMKS